MRNGLKNQNLKHIVLAAVFAALVFLGCYIGIAFPGGYIHVADAFIYIMACLLPMPYAMAGAAIGAGIADAVLAPVYIIGTIIIKPLYVPFFSRKQEKILTFKNVIATIFAGGVCVIGYYLYQVILVKSFTGALATIPWNLAQAGAGTVVFVILAAALDKIKIKRFL